MVVTPWVYLTPLGVPDPLDTEHTACFDTVDHSYKFETLRRNLRELEKPSPIRPPDGPRPPRVGEFRTV